ncbi:MAG TPA: polymer-forming cytoskeletal protein, partial [Leptospiraceae bacterium]|nr:polymer-forming cytoskeletal protein [Leptospiraceae bacterium]
QGGLASGVGPFHVDIPFSGQFRYDLSAGDLAVDFIVEGIIVGNITARNRVMLLPTARILGDISTPELIIQNGVILEGRCMISNDLKHSARDYIESEYGRDNLTLERLFGTRARTA